MLQPLYSIAMSVNSNLFGLNQEIHPDQNKNIMINGNLV